MKLLIIEDEIDLANAIAKGFNKKGYQTDIATDGKEGLELYFINEYDLILLDLNLPSMDGIEVLKEIRKEDQNQKVLILSARCEVFDKILGLDVGANDYLPKPFDFGELEARVRSLLRREFVQHNTIIEYKGLKLDTKINCLTAKNGKMIELAPKEYGIFEYLLLNRNQVISAEKLIEHVWESDADFFSASLKVHVSNLRKKLIDVCEEDVIVTVRKKGYTLEAE